LGADQVELRFQRLGHWLGADVDHLFPERLPRLLEQFFLGLLFLFLGVFDLFGLGVDGLLLFALDFFFFLFDA